MNLLRQEISGTTIYLEILHKSTTKELNGTSSEGLEEEKKLKILAEEKLVSFCGNVLREASDLQPNTVEAAGSTTGADIHRVLDLRAPIIVKVHIFLTPMRRMCLLYVLDSSCHIYMHVCSYVFYMYWYIRC